MKRRFLVVYDYGQGGVWASIEAHSRAEIERRLPEVEIVEKRPDWLSRHELARIEQRMSLDLDSPRGWLADVIGKRRGDIAAG